MTAPTPPQGPCSDWITGADVADRCALDPSYGSDPAVYDHVAHVASQVLWALSGRQFTGVCSATVRPCAPTCSCWPVLPAVSPGVLGSVYWDFGGFWGGWWSGGGTNGCCGCLSRVKLAGYPVIQIEEVKIDGVPVDPANYRLDGWRWLTAIDTAGVAVQPFAVTGVNAGAGLVSVAGGDSTALFPAGSTITIVGSTGNDGTYTVVGSAFGGDTEITVDGVFPSAVADGTVYNEGQAGQSWRWPACQNLAADDDQPGTFTVTYTFGVDPPAVGLDAAAELACMLATAIGGGDCGLPPGTTKITRQGVTIDMDTLAQALRLGITGLPLTDLFLATVNPSGLTRRTTVFSPDAIPYAQKYGS